MCDVNATIITKLHFQQNANALQPSISRDSTQNRIDSLFRISPETLPPFTLLLFAISQFTLLR